MQTNSLSGNREYDVLKNKNASLWKALQIFNKIKRHIFKQINI